MLSVSQSESKIKEHPKSIDETHEIREGEQATTSAAPPEDKANDPASALPQTEAASEVPASSTPAAHSATSTEGEQETIEFVEAPLPPPSSPAILSDATSPHDLVEEYKKKFQKKQQEHLEEQLKSKHLNDELRRLQEELQRVTKEKEEFYERLARLSADYDNMRKRTQREREDLRRYGHEALVKDLLPLLDNFDLAIKSLQDAPASTREGVEMLSKQYLDILSHHGVHRFASTGQPFDYNLHEAISMVENDEYADGTVLQEYRAGYKLHERLLRPAMVSVAKAPVKPVQSEKTNKEIVEEAKHEATSSSSEEISPAPQEATASEASAESTASSSSTETPTGTEKPS
jgi:molecular chaperone GrpE